MSNSREEPAFMWPPALSKKMGISLSTLRRIVQSGDLPAYRLGKRWAVKREDFEEYVRRLPRVA